VSDIYDSQTYEPRKGIAYLVNRVRMEFMAAVDREMAHDEHLSSLEMSSAQFTVIATLSMGVAKSASDLCKGIQYDAGAMTRMLDRLEEKGLLRRSRDPTDRRLVNLELTEKGMDALPRMRDISIRVLNRFLQGFTRAEARQVEGLLTRIMENAVKLRTHEGE
jgi:MarR family transcriptional regulator, multiple antibiotic resistance protein MarR